MAVHMGLYPHLRFRFHSRSSRLEQSKPDQILLLQALAALFLMNNAHYQLKAVQSNNMMNLISREWQDDCEAKVIQLDLLPVQTVK